MNPKTFSQLVTAIAGTTITLFFQHSDALAMNIIDEVYGVGTGSFELGNFVNNGMDWMFVAPGDNTTLTGWTVGGPGNGINWLTENGFNADTGIHALDLSHTSRSSIATTIPTTIGASYQLSFAATAIFNSTTQGFVSAGSLINQEFTANAVTSDTSNQVYNFHNFQFTANDTLTTVTFTAGNSSSTYGPVIDSVSVVSASSVSVPESSNLLGLGLFLVAGVSLITEIKIKKK